MFIFKTEPKHDHLIDQFPPQWQEIISRFYFAYSYTVKAESHSCNLPDVPIMSSIWHRLSVTQETLILLFQYIWDAFILTLFWGAHGFLCRNIWGLTNGAVTFTITHPY